MKKVLFASAMLIASAGIFSFIPAKKYADTLTVDVAKSKVEWNGAAGDHYHPGTVALKSGTVTVDGGKVTGGHFVFDLSSIKSTDGAGDRLDNTIKGTNFFDVAKFGEASYDITGVSYTSDNTATVSGNLNVKGTVLPVSFTAKVRGLKDGKLFAEAFFSLDSKALGFEKYGADIAVHLFAAK